MRSGTREDWPGQERLRGEVVAGLFAGPVEEARHDKLLKRERWLKSARVVGRVLCHAAEYRGK